MNMKELQQKLGVNRSKIYRLRDSLGMTFNVTDKGILDITEEQYMTLHNALHGVTGERVSSKPKILKRKASCDKEDICDNMNIHDAIKLLSDKGVLCVISFHGRAETLLNNKEREDVEELLRMHEEFLELKHQWDINDYITKVNKYVNKL